MKTLAAALLLALAKKEINEQNLKDIFTAAGAKANEEEIKKVEDATFVGYTCLEHDHIYEGFSGELAVGDLVQFRNVGSYSNVFKPPFILPNCAMIQIDGDGTPSLMKRAETIDDLFHTYVF